MALLLLYYYVVIEVEMTTLSTTVKYDYTDTVRQRK